MDLDCRTIVPYYFILFDNVAITVHGKDAAGWRDVIDRVLNDVCGPFSSDSAYAFEILWCTSVTFAT